MGTVLRTCGAASAWYRENVSDEVDVTLVQETLAHTPQQRIQQTDRTLRMIDDVRDDLAKAGNPLAMLATSDARFDRVSTTWT